MKRNPVEWAVLVASVLAITVLVAALVIEGLGEQRPANPRVELRLAEARMGTLGWVLPATVTNDGDLAAEAVSIEAEATVGGALETSGVEVPFLPGRSSVDLAFSFSAQPSDEVTVRLVGFREP